MSVSGIVLIVVFTLVGAGFGLAIALTHINEKPSLVRKVISVILCCAVGTLVGFVASFCGVASADYHIQEQQKHLCQECHQRFDYSDNFCSKCGAVRERCSSCGNKIELDDEFCSDCGTKVVKEGT